MVVQADQDRMKQLLSEALPMLCRSGLSFSSQFCVEALIGITLDKNDVMLVSIKETIKSEGAEDSEPEKSVEVNISKVPSDAAGSGRKPHRKRRRSKSKNQEESSDSETNDMPDGQTAMKREKMDNSTLESASDFDNTNTSIPYGSSEHGESKHNVDDDNDSHDAVIVKEEPGDFSSVSFGDMNSSHNYDPDQSHEMLANQTFPGTSYGTNAPSIIVPNAATNQNQLANTSLEEQTSSWVWNSADGSVDYRLFGDSSVRGSMKMMDSEGYIYAVKDRSPKRIVWWCHHRKYRKGDARCNFVLFQTPGGFIVNGEHNHPSDPDIRVRVEVVNEIRRRIRLNPMCSVTEVVRESFTAVRQRTDLREGKMPNETAMTRNAQRVKLRLFGKSSPGKKVSKKRTASAKECAEQTKESDERNSLMQDALVDVGLRTMHTAFTSSPMQSTNTLGNYVTAALTRLYGEEQNVDVEKQ